MDAEAITMDWEGIGLIGLSRVGLEISSFAVEPASASQNQVNRRVDDMFTVTLYYKDDRNPNERTSTFTLPKETEGDSDVFLAVARELETINADSETYDAVAEVVEENCDFLRQEVTDSGRTSLAMVVEIEYSLGLTAYHDVAPVSEGDTDEEDDDDEEALAAASSEEVKNLLSSNGGVKFVSCDQISSSTNMECCSICLEEFQKQEKNKGEIKHDRVAVLPCSHLFHEDCLVAWIATGKKTCPLCRFKLLLVN